jgi:hypothetical protein
MSMGLDPSPEEAEAMYVVAQHRIVDPKTAFERGGKLFRNEGAPAGVRGLQFYPSTDGTAVTCLWEAPSTAAVQSYVDSVLGDSSVNATYQVDATQAFAQKPDGIRESAGVGA